MEFDEANFRDEFPYYSNLFLENNPKQDSINLVGSSNATGFQALLNSNPFVNPFSTHPHHLHQDAHGHGHPPVDNHHHGVFPTDLNFDPRYAMSGSHVGADDYHHGHEGDVGHHQQDHHVDGDEPMIPLEHILTFHDLNMMPEDNIGSSVSPVADADEKKWKKEKVVEAPPEKETVQGDPNAPTEITIRVKGQWSPEEDRYIEGSCPWKRTYIHTRIYVVLPLILKNSKAKVWLT